MSGQKVGYVRVSSVDQSTERQLDGTELDRVFTDKASGGSSNRPQLAECLSYLRQGDTLHVHSIDRLARNLQDLLDLLKRLAEQGVTVRFHKESLTFTGESNPFQELQLHIIGAVAQFERALIRERQREGIASAKRAGKHLGRKAALSSAQVKELRARKERGEAVTALAQEFGVSRQTIYSALKQEACR